MVNNNDNWENVKDELPPDTRTVIIFTDDDVVTVGWYWDGLGAGWKGDFIGNVTHWMFLPTAPNRITERTSERGNGS